MQRYIPASVPRRESERDHSTALSRVEAGLLGGGRISKSSRDFGAFHPLLLSRACGTWTPPAYLTFQWRCLDPFFLPSAVNRVAPGGDGVRELFLIWEAYIIPTPISTCFCLVLLFSLLLILSSGDSVAPLTVPVYSTHRACLRAASSGGSAAPYRLHWAGH